MLVPAIIAFVAGYVVGALPVAWILVRRRHGIDLRSRTSRGSSTGSALFVAGPRTAVAAGILECAKGAVVGLAARLYSPSGWFIAVAVAGCVVGDAFPAGFRRGGRGLLPLVTALVVALPTAGLITAIAAVPAALLTSMRGRIFDTVVAVAVPVGLLLGTRDSLSLIPAGVIVAAILLRQRIRRRRRDAQLIREPIWQSMVIDADLPVPQATPGTASRRQNRGPWGTF
jgi:glycerol-3-phosphate acyltransferase PlsY